MRNLKLFTTAFLFMASAGASYAATGAYLEPQPAAPHYMQVADIRDVVRDGSDGTVVRSSSGECVRTKWMDNGDPCGTQAVAVQPMREIHQAAALSREDRTVYFGFNQGSISPEMKDRLNSLAGVLRSDQQVRGARIVGYADRIGNAKYNEKLSKLRAENVRQYLVAHGIINTSVADTHWVGASEPATSCSSDLSRPDLINCLQKDRRVEVEIDYAPDQRAAQ